MKKILITAAFGYLAVLLTGMLFYRFEIFDIHKHYFQITELGLIGAVMYPVFLYREKREIIFSAVLIFILHFIFFQPYRTTYIIRDLIVIAALISSIGVFARVFLPMIGRKYRIIRIFALPFIYGIINVVAFFVLLALLNLFFSPSPIPVPETILLYLRYGIMIGTGLAIGFNFADFIIKTYINETSGGE